MHRSSSGFLNLKIDFNPRQCRSGSSSIDRLPVRRTSSLKSIHKQSVKQPDRFSHKIRKNLKTQEQKQQAMKESLQYQMDVLKRVNESLSRQNAYLKQRVEFISSKLNKITQQNQLQGKQKYKQKLLMRIGKNDGENRNMFINTKKNIQDFTIQSTGFGLVNSKMSTARKTFEENILEYYDRFETKGVLPKCDALKQSLDAYLDSIQEIYHKTKQITDQMNRMKEGDQNNRKSKDQLKKINDQLELLELTVLYRKNPKITKSLFKDPIKYNKKESAVTNNFKLADFCPELSSPTQIMAVYENVTKFILKNPKLLDKIKVNPYVGRLNRKLKQ